MVIDLDDDDDEPAAEQTQADAAEFAQEDEEVDEYAPYGDILRYVDIPLGTAAARIAIPSVPRDLPQAPPESWPSIFLERIVVAVACTDLTLRIVSVPLDPPAPGIRDISKMDVQTLKIFGPNSHQEFISDISVTHTSFVSLEEDNDEAQQKTRAQTRLQSKKEGTEPEAEQHWSLLIASVSCTGSGLLLVHQIPLQSSNQISTNPEHFLPIRRQYLCCSTMSAKLSFNKCPYPAERHSNILITLPASCCVKLYQVFPTYTRERRGSTATADSMSSTRSSRTYGSERGKFLITFLPPFVEDNTEVIQRRKRVLDAQWIATGRAITALLEDGEWGIWDLEAVGPSSSSTGGNLIRGQGNISGIHGGAMSRFAIRSSIFPFVETKQKSSASDAQSQPASGSLAPMTPSTRKLRSEGLFQGSKRDDPKPLDAQHPFGSIYVEETTSNRLPHDEAVMLSYAEENIYIASILSFWKGEVKPLRLPGVRLGGQTPRSISILPRQDSSNRPSGLFETVSMPNFLIQTSHRLTLSLNPLSSQPGTTDTSTQTVPGQFSDQALLASGELDVEGMGRILDDMGGNVLKKPMNLFTKSVGFRIDDQDKDDSGDVDMTASPIPARYNTSGRAKIESQTSQRRIFT